MALGLFYCSYISFRGLRLGEYLSRRLVLSGFILALVVLIIMGLGAGALFVFADATDIWLDAGFYGGAIGNLLTTIFLGYNLKNTITRSNKPLHENPNIYKRQMEQ